MSRLFPIDDALDSDAWYTPPWIFEGMCLEFDLDVAHPAEPLEWIPAVARFTVADDGLGQPWHGLVWCNPPFSDAGPWCRRWAEHPEGCLLIRSDLSSAGAIAAFAAATAMFVPRRRIGFVDGSAHRRPDQHRPTVSTLILSRGARADGGLARLARHSGGITRGLS